MIRNRRSMRKKHSEVNELNISCRDLGKADHEGWLSKKAGGHSLIPVSWKRYWCVLKKENLYCFKTSFDVVADYYFPLKVYEVEAATEKKKDVFKLTTQEEDKKSAVFAGEKNEIQRWVEVIKQIKTGNSVSLEQDANVPDYEERRRVYSCNARIKEDAKRRPSSSAFPTNAETTGLPSAFNSRTSSVSHGRVTRTTSNGKPESCLAFGSMFKSLEEPEDGASTPTKENGDIHSLLYREVTITPKDTPEAVRRKNEEMEKLNAEIAKLNSDMIVLNKNGERKEKIALPVMADETKHEKPPSPKKEDVERTEIQENSFLSTEVDSRDTKTTSQLFRDLVSNSNEDGEKIVVDATVASENKTHEHELPTVHVSTDDTKNTFNNHSVSIEISNELPNENSETASKLPNKNSETTSELPNENSATNEKQTNDPSEIEVKVNSEPHTEDTSLENVDQVSNQQSFSTDGTKKEIITESENTSENDTERKRTEDNEPSDGVTEGKRIEADKRSDDAIDEKQIEDNKSSDDLTEEETRTEEEMLLVNVFIEKHTEDDKPSDDVPEEIRTEDDKTSVDVVRERHMEDNKPSDDVPKEIRTENDKTSDDVATEKHTEDDKPSDDVPKKIRTENDTALDDVATEKHTEDSKPSDDVPKEIRTENDTTSVDVTTEKHTEDDKPSQEKLIEEGKRSDEVSIEKRIEDDKPLDDVIEKQIESGSVEKEENFDERNTTECHILSEDHPITTQHQTSQSKDVDAVTSDDIDAVTPKEDDFVKSEDIDAVTSKVVDAQMSIDVGAVMSEDVDAVTPEDVDTVTPKDIDTVTSRDVYTVTSEDVDTVTSKDVDVETSEDVDAVTSEYVDTVTSKDVDAVTSKDVDAVLSEQIKSTTEDVSKETPASEHHVDIAVTTLDRTSVSLTANNVHSLSNHENEAVTQQSKNEEAILETTQVIVQSGKDDSNLLLKENTPKHPNNGTGFGVITPPDTPTSDEIERETVHDTELDGREGCNDEKINSLINDPTLTKDSNGHVENNSCDVDAYIVKGETQSSLQSEKNENEKSSDSDQKTEYKFQITQHEDCEQLSEKPGNENLEKDKPQGSADEDFNNRSSEEKNNGMSEASILPALSTPLDSIGDRPTKDMCNETDKSVDLANSNHIDKNDSTQEVSEKTMADLAADKCYEIESTNDQSIDKTNCSASKTDDETSTSIGQTNENNNSSTSETNDKTNNSTGQDTNETDSSTVQTTDADSVADEANDNNKDKTRDTTSFNQDNKVETSCEVDSSEKITEVDLGEDLDVPNLSPTNMSLSDEISFELNLSHSNPITT